MFIGLNDGRILKVVNQVSSSANGQNQPIIVAEYQLFAQNTPVNSILIHSPETSGRGTVKKLIAVSNREIKSLSLDFQCDKYKTCQQCVQSQDPYCAWSTHAEKCVYAFKNESTLVQDSPSGDLTTCDSSVETKTDADVYYSINTEGASMGLRDSTSDAEIQRRDVGPSASVIFMLVFFTAFLTSVFSVVLTCICLKKRYELSKMDFDALKSSSSSSESTSTSVSWSSRTRRLLFSFNRLHSHLLRRFRDRDTPTPEKGGATDTKAKKTILNCYESSGICQKSGLKPVTVLCNSSTNSRPNSTSDDSSPTNTSSLTASSSSNNNSPNNSGLRSSEDDDLVSHSNNLLTPVAKYSNVVISGALSSSDDSFEQRAPVLVRSQNSGRTNNPKRYQKMTNTMKSASDSSNVTTNLLRELDV